MILMNKIKKIIFALTLLFPLLGKAQAHLGSTLADLKEFHPDKTFEIDYTTTGTKYAKASMPLGTFVYYFNSEGITVKCLQFPDNMTALNTQVEIYNKKYVIISEKSWKAYLEGGGLLKINLEYNEEEKFYVFHYTN